MVHVFFYMNGLHGEVGDLMVLPKSQTAVIARGAMQDLFKEEELPVSTVWQPIRTRWICMTALPACVFTPASCCRLVFIVASRVHGVVCARNDLSICRQGSLFFGGGNAGPLSARSSFSKQTHKDAAVAPFVGDEHTPPSNPRTTGRGRRSTHQTPGGNRCPVQHLVVLIGWPPIGHSRTYRGPPDILIGRGGSCLI